MNKQIFVNLPVKDLDKSTTFFNALGYTFNSQFTNEKRRLHGDRGRQHLRDAPH